MSANPPTNKVDLTVKHFDKHMVVDDYRIVLESPTEPVEKLIEKAMNLKEKLESKA